MGSVKKFISELESANTDAVINLINNASEPLVHDLYEVLQRVDSPEAAQFLSWLGKGLSELKSGTSSVFEFALHFVPQLIWLHLNMIGSSKTREEAVNVDCVLIYIYNQICADPAFAKDIRLSSPEHGSIYHDAAAGRQHLSLTVSALHSETHVATIGGFPSAMKVVDRIYSANRSIIIGTVLNYYCQAIGNRLEMSLLAFCHMCTRICLSGFDVAEACSRGTASDADFFATQLSPLAASRSTEAPAAGIKEIQSRGRRLECKSYPLAKEAVLELSQRPRHSLEPAVFQEFASGIHSCLFNGHGAAGKQALHALHFRALESLIPDVLLMTRALLHCLEGPCGSPTDGLFGLSAQLFSSLPQSSRPRSSANASDGQPANAPDISVQEPSPSASPTATASVSRQIIKLQDMATATTTTTSTASTTDVGLDGSDSAVETLV